MGRLNVAICLCIPVLGLLGFLLIPSSQQRPAPSTLPGYAQLVPLASVLKAPHNKNLGPEPSGLNHGSSSTTIRSIGIEHEELNEGGNETTTSAVIPPSAAPESPEGVNATSILSGAVQQPVEQDTNEVFTGEEIEAFQTEQTERIKLFERAWDDMDRIIPEKGRTGVPSVPKQQQPEKTVSPSTSSPFSVPVVEEFSSSLPEKTAKSQKLHHSADGSPRGRPRGQVERLSPKGRVGRALLHSDMSIKDNDMVESSPSEIAEPRHKKLHRTDDGDTHAHDSASAEHPLPHHAQRRRRLPSTGSSVVNSVEDGFVEMGRSQATPSILKSVRTPRGAPYSPFMSSGRGRRLGADKNGFDLDSEAGSDTEATKKGAPLPAEEGPGPRLHRLELTRLPARSPSLCQPLRLPLGRRATPCEHMKHVIFVRHALSLGNVWRVVDQANFSRYTPKDVPLATPARCAKYHLPKDQCIGAWQATSAGRRLHANFTKSIQLLIVSPLQRTIETAALMFAKYTGPVELNELCSEQVNSRTAHGHTLAELRDFLREIAPKWWANKQINLSRLEQFGENATWWDSHEKQVVMRHRLFDEYLRNRPERHIAVVTHGTFLSRFIRAHLGNTQIVQYLWPSNHPT